MNDTFDDFTFSILDGNDPSPASDRNNGTGDVSLDDSTFLNEYTLKSPEQDKHSTEEGNEQHYSIATAQVSRGDKDSLGMSVEDPSPKATDKGATFPLPENGDKENESLSPSLDGSFKHNYYFEDETKLSSWNLPLTILEKYKQKNLTCMFRWQVECLNNSKVLKHNKNLVYSAPTSAGKTLVAELLAIKTLFEHHKKVIFVLPFVSIVREKMYYFQDLLGTSGVRVEGFMGSYNPPGGFSSVQMAICTIEKANSLINKLLEEGKLSDIGAVLIDEMHLLGDPSRGYILELLLTKLRYISLKNEDINIQIIGMSATLPNLKTLSKWLDAELYVTDYRPVPLHEQAIVCGEVYDENLKLVRKLSPIPDINTDTDNVLQLCLETIGGGRSVLIFCPTKNWCENLAVQISTAFYKIGSMGTQWGEILRSEIKTTLIKELLQQLKFCPVGLDDVLRKTVSFGVAFHHAGLTMDERDIIEGAYRNGALRVLVATSTLSSGVNLPARRVIIRTPHFNGRIIDALTYRQMIGRAGRLGKDSMGESYLVCQRNDQKIAKELMSANLRPVESCLVGEGKLKRAILEVVASGVAMTPKDVQMFTECTLLSTESEEDESLCDPIEDAVQFLISNEFMRLQYLQEGGVRYVATSLGKACLSSSMAPDEGLALFSELDKARQCFALDTELHLIYLVTPYSVCHSWGEIDWMFYLNLWEKLPASMRRVGEMVGVKESYIVNATRSKVQTNTHKLYHRFMVHKRFLVALVLQDLVEEKPLQTVCSKFNCNRGLLQSLQQSASSFAGMVTTFSKQLGWGGVELLVSQFQDRLQFGVGRDLLDLMRLTVLNGKVARILHTAGIETLPQLANSTILDIENILHRTVPFESDKGREGESEFETRQRNKCKHVWINGRDGLTERKAAEIFVTEARKHLKFEMGLVEAKWETSALNCSKDSAIETREEEHLELKPESFIIEDNPSSSLLNSKESSENKPDYMFIFPPVKQTTTEVSQILMTQSTGELNISNSSNSSLSISLEQMCITDHSFVLKLDKDSIIDRSMNNTTAGSSDLFASSPDTPASKKRKSPSMYYGTPSKKIKSTDNDDEIEIVDVTKDSTRLQIFTDQLQQQKFVSLSLACSKIKHSDTNVHLTTAKQPKPPYSHRDIKLDGIAISWGENRAYHLSLTDPNLGEKVMDEIEKLVKNKNVVIRMFDAKEQIKQLLRCHKVRFRAQIEDPKVADWILDPEGREETFQQMASKYYPGSLELSTITNTCTDIRAGVEAIIIWRVVESLKCNLAQSSPFYLKIYDTEMAVINCLTNMEVKGMSVNLTRLQNLVGQLETQLEAIEAKSFSITGRRFNLASPHEVAKILRIFQGKKVSTKKQILEQMTHPIAKLVLDWRKINHTLRNMLYPLILSVNHNRIHGCYVTRTATGRITMNEPNLQSITKDFTVTDPVSGDVKNISCRSAFAAPEGHCLISADYCQMELRILAHFSQDELLCDILRRPGDVFRAIAAKWNNVDEDEVTDSMRQNTKQLCYGIIYGMGSKALAGQLGVEENEAMTFMETFKNTYPGIKTFVQKTISECQETGFVETISGRRRYLKNINHNLPKKKGHAERQAVNTKVQGTAADIAKGAMIQVEAELHRIFHKSKNKPKLVLHLHDEMIYEAPLKYRKKVVKVLKKTMEGSVSLSVPFPTKLKTGSSWGEMTEYF